MNGLTQGTKTFGFHILKKVLNELCLLHLTAAEGARKKTAENIIHLISIMKALCNYLILFIQYNRLLYLKYLIINILHHKEARNH